MKKLSIKKSALGLALAGVLALPIVVRAYAQEAPTPEPEPTNQQVAVAQEEPTPVTPEPVPTPPQPAPTPVVDETPVDQDEVPVEDETEETTDITLNDALVIAQTEHSDSPVVLAKVKLKKLSGETVYKFVFADGWRIYVRASDGEIIRIKDPADKKHDCSNRGRGASASWRNKKWHKHGERAGRSHGNNQNNWRNGDKKHHWSSTDQNQSEQDDSDESTVPTTQAETNEQ